MMLKVQCGIIAACIVCSVGLAYAESANTMVSVSLDYWRSTLSAGAKLSSDAGVGTSVDMVDDLGFDDALQPDSIEATLDFPLMPEIGIGYIHADDRTTKDITRTLLVNDITYAAGANVTSAYDYTSFTAHLGFGVVQNDTLLVRLLLGGKYFDIETEITNNTTASSVREDIQMAMPLVGAVVEIGLPKKFKVGAVAKGMTLNVGDMEATLLDLDVAVHYEIARFLRVSGGYRYEMVEAEDTKIKDSIDITFAGPFVGITGSF